MQRLEKLFNNVRKTNSVAKSCPTFSRYLCTEKSKDEGVKDLSEKPEEQNIFVEVTDDLLRNSNQNETEKKLGGFATSFQKYTSHKEEQVKGKSFAALLRDSKFIDLGDPQGKVVKGKITHVVENDLHIDFGWKFNCVCKRPPVNASDYVRGSIVRLKIKELELSTRFLGSTKDLTILEADCILLGLIWSPQRGSNPSSEVTSKM